MEGVGGPKQNKSKLLTDGDTSKGGAELDENWKNSFQSLSYCKFSNLSQYPISHQSVLDEMQFRFYFLILPSLCQQFSKQLQIVCNACLKL